MTSSRHWTRPLAGLLLAGGLALFTALALSPGARADHELAAPGTGIPAETHHPREKTYIKRTWGVEILFVRETAAGYMLEFRYKVLDADKAAPLFVRQTKPVLTHAESGAKLAVPVPAKTGALRNSNTPISGRTYWMVFANPGNLVKPGDHVSIEIGEFHIDNLVVQ